MRILTSVLGLLYLVSHCACAVPHFTVYEVLPRPGPSDGYLHELTTITPKGEAKSNIEFINNAPKLDKSSPSQGFVVTSDGISATYNFVITAEYTYIPRGSRRSETIEFEITGPVVDGASYRKEWHLIEDDFITADDIAADDEETAAEWGSATIESLGSIGDSADSAPIEGPGVAADSSDAASIGNEAAENRESIANAKTAGKTRPIKDWVYYYGNMWHSWADATDFQKSLPEPNLSLTQKEGFKITQITFEEQTDLSHSGILVDSI